MLESPAAPLPVDRARELHRRTLVCDLHCDSILAERDLLVRSDTGRPTAGIRSSSGSPGPDSGLPKGLPAPDAGHLDLPRLEEAGVKAQVFAIWSDPKKLGPGGYEAHVAGGIARLRSLCDRAPGRIAHVLSPEELESAVGSGRVAGIVGVEGGHALEGDVGRLEQWWDAGVRLLTITWCNSNELADGGWDDNQPHAGLSAVGRVAIAEMNRLGMIVDVSHCSEQSFWQILEASNAPVVASHSGARALCDHPRNLTDLQLRALAQQGGMMGVVFLPAFLKPEPEPTSVEDVVTAIDHIVQLIGPGHVGLGSDWDGFGAGPAGLEDVSKLPAVTAGLLRRGYPEAGIELILGRNFLRVWAAIQSSRAT